METIPSKDNNKSVVKIERAAYILAVLFLSFSLIKEAVTRTTFQNDVQELLFENKELKKEVLDDSSKIYSMQMSLADADLIIASQKETIELLNIRNPKEVVKWRTKTIIKDTLFVAKPVTFDSTEYLRLPQSISEQNKWYSLEGQINTKGYLQIDSLVSYANFSYAVGDTMRRGLLNRMLGKKDKVVRLHIDNPYIDVSGMQNIYLREQKKWYETTLFQFGAGFLVGATFMGVSK
jgi:hypothetical protein